MFVDVVSGQPQVVVDAPEPATGRALTGFNGVAHVLGGASFEPGAAPANGTERMGIAVAEFRPAVDFAVGAHGDTIGVDATETGIPGFYTIEPDILVGIDTIQHFALAAMAKNAIHRVGYDSQAALFMHQVDTAFYAQAGGDAFLYEESEHMALLCADLFANDIIETIVSFSPQVARA